MASLIKFNPTYTLTVQMADGGSQAIQIKQPITLQYDVRRSAMASLNEAFFTIYNLGETTRGRIYQDRFLYLKNNIVTFSMGYGGKENLVFVGTIIEASHARQGTQVVTTIRARDGGFDVMNTRSFRTENAGVTLQQLIKNLIGDFPNLNQGTLGDLPGQFSRPVVIDGNTFDIMRRYTGARAFIDLQTVNVLADNEAIEGDVPLIDDTTGLLETPRREDSFLAVTTLPEPGIVMGQAVALRSSVLPLYNGQYKVIGVQHSGIISGAENGQRRSVFNLLLGSQVFGTMKVLTPPATMKPKSATP